MQKHRCSSKTAAGRRCRLSCYGDAKHCHVHLKAGIRVIEEWWYRVHLIDKIVANYWRIDGVRKYALHWLETTRKNQILEEVCQICLENFRKRRDIEDGNYVKTACGHEFHMTCLNTWWIDKDKFTCPYCRADYTSADTNTECCFEITIPRNSRLESLVPRVSGSYCHLGDRVYLTDTRKVWFAVSWPMIRLQKAESLTFDSNYLFENVSHPHYLDVHVSEKHEIPVWARKYMQTVTQEAIPKIGNILMMNMVRKVNDPEPNPRLLEWVQHELSNNNRTQLLAWIQNRLFGV